jgi:hypothetical protein
VYTSVQITLTLAYEETTATVYFAKPTGQPLFELPLLPASGGNHGEDGGRGG